MPPPSRLDKAAVSIDLTTGVFAMSAIGMILVFVAAIVGLNLFEFGRID